MVSKLSLMTNLRHKVFPKIVKEASQKKLRSAGISIRKAGYLIVMPEKFWEKNYPLNDENKLKYMTNEQIAKLLPELKGIGPWAVEMFLLLHMKSSDVFPIRYITVGLSTFMQNSLSTKKNRN